MLSGKEDFAEVLKDLSRERERYRSENNSVGL